MTTLARSIGLWIALASLFATTVGAVCAAEQPSAARTNVVRIVPNATPVELDPCASGACF